MIDFSIVLIHWFFFFNFCLIVDNVRNSIRSSLKNHFNFIVSLLFFSVILLILFNNFTFDICCKFVFFFSFFIFNVNFFSFFAIVKLVVVVFLLNFSSSCSIYVIFVIAFITFAYVFALIDWLTFCFSFFEIYFRFYSVFELVLTVFRCFSLNLLSTFRSLFTVFFLSVLFYSSSDQQLFFLTLLIKFVFWILVVIVWLSLFRNFFDSSSKRSSNDITSILFDVMKIRNAKLFASVFN